MPKTIVFHTDVQLPDSEVPKDGTVMNGAYYDRVVRAEDYNLKSNDAILVYKPNPRVPDIEELLFCLVHDAISRDLCHMMMPILRKVAASPVAGGNRPKAAGADRVPRLKKDGTRGKVTVTPTINDPLLGDANRARLRGAADGIVGSLGPGVRGGEEYECRLSYWTKHHREETDVLMPLVNNVNGAFRKYAAGPFDNQLTAALKSRPWLLGTPDFYSVFTTITVNRSFQTACHTDKGDLKEGLGVLACFGDFKGSHLIFPKFRTAVEFGQGDILLADVGHEVHGNSELLFPDGRAATEFEKPERLSCVFYFQEKMQNCANKETASTEVPQA